MGRHKDPDILKFIETYKKKGESWGFKVDDEFKLLNGVYWVDLLWTPYEDEHKMYITFEIEKKDERTLKNLDKIFETPASDVEKPYQHFVVIYDCKLSAGNKKIVQEKARRYNIHIFENLKNDTEELERFDEELERLKIVLSGYIERKGKVTPAETVRETVIGLGKVVPVLIIGNKEFLVQEATLTSGSQVIQKEPLTREPKQLFDSKKYKKIAVIAIPREQYTLTIPSTPIAFNVYLEKKENVKSISLFVEACDFPFILDFVLNIGGGGRFNIRIDPELADVVQLKMFEDTLRGLDNKKTMEIFNQSGKRIFLCEGLNSDNPRTSSQWYDAVSDLAYIQSVTAQKIPSPKNLTLSSKDLAAIEKLKNIIEKGELLVPIVHLTLRVNREVVEKLIGFQKASGKIFSLSIQLDQTSEQLIGQEIVLGAATIELPEMKFKEPLEEVEKRLFGIGPNVTREINLIAYSATQARIVYQKMA
jgi:hypothetical protein